jgi:hypothetical protein
MVKDVPIIVHRKGVAVNTQLKKKQFGLLENGF